MEKLQKKSQKSRKNRDFSTPPGTTENFQEFVHAMAFVRGIVRKSFGFSPLFSEKIQACEVSKNWANFKKIIFWNPKKVQKFNLTKKSKSTHFCSYTHKFLC